MSNYVFYVRSGCIVFVRLIDRNRKGGQFFLLEEYLAVDEILTPQELAVRCWLRRAKTDEEIAKIMGLKTNTVKKHLTHILDKLGAPNRTAAAYYADRFSTADE